MGLKLNHVQARRVATWLRETREARGLTITGLAHEASVSPDSIGKIERCENGPQGPNFATVARIEDALGLAQGTMRAVAYDEPHPRPDDDQVRLLKLLRGQMREIRRETADLRGRLERLEDLVDGSEDPQP